MEQDTSESSTGDTEEISTNKKSTISSRSPSATIRRIGTWKNEAKENYNTNNTFSTDSLTGCNSVEACSRPSSIDSSFSNGPAGFTLSEYECKEIIEIFNTFDKNGGGSVDLQDLHKFIKNSGIKLCFHDLKKVAPILHRNDEGGISFQEFVNAITKSSHFIANLGTPSKFTAERIFRVLLECLRVSAFKSVAETGSKRDARRNSNCYVLHDHVVFDYSAGAKNLGLPDSVVCEKMAQIKAANTANGTSQFSYAAPLHIQGRDPVEFQKMKVKGRITLLVRNGNAPTKPYLPPRVRQHRPNRIGVALPNWRSQRTENIAVNLPPVHLRCLLPFKLLTEANMPVICHQVNKAIDEFKTTKRKNFVDNSLRHFDNLHEDLITPEPLRHSFRALFSTYTDISLNRLPPLVK